MLGAAKYEGCDIECLVNTSNAVKCAGVTQEFGTRPGLQGVGPTGILHIRGHTLTCADRYCCNCALERREWSGEAVNEVQQGRPRHADNACNHHFTCCTSTKVQILTRVQPSRKAVAARRGRRRYSLYLLYEYKRFENNKY